MAAAAIILDIDGLLYRPLVVIGRDRAAQAPRLTGAPGKPGGERRADPGRG